MDSIKEKLSEHCEKVAFGLVGFITVVILVLNATREDTVGDLQVKIRKHADKIDEKRKIDQLKVLKEHPVDDVPGVVEAHWKGTPLKSEPFRSFVVYRQPTIVRLFQGEDIERNIHPAADIVQLTIERDSEAKKPIVIVNYKLGKLVNAELVDVTVVRTTAGSTNPEDKQEFKNAAAGEQGTSEQELQYSDSTVEPGTSYVYQIKTTANRTADGTGWDSGSRPIQESNEAPPEGQREGFVVPYDYRVMLLQVQPSDSVGEPGTAWFKCEFWDYEKNQLNKENSFVERKEVISGQPKEEDLIPGTDFYLNLLRKTDKGWEAILRSIHKRTVRLNLIQGTWNPPVVEVPPPWQKGAEAKAAPEEPKAAEPAPEEPAPEEPPAEEPPGEEPPAEEPPVEEPPAEEPPAEEPEKKPEDTGPFR